MSEKIQAIRGMSDVLPAESPYWQKIESICRNTVSQYGYREIRFPILEQTKLFKRGVGEVTDIVEKEMYTFDDRNGDSLSMRPEGTASCVRAGIEHGLLYNQIQRLWYMGPMFRHERPQKGRLRQFHQLGVEAFGMLNPAIDVEMILLSKRILDQLGLGDQVVLQINNLGTFADRDQYRDVLVNYFSQHKEKLDEDSLRRLEKNPLRILDSKNPSMRELISAAPKASDHIHGVGALHFKQICDALTQLKIPYEVNPHLVRGLDYYDLTVFEWVTNNLGAQGTVCAGGRYDRLARDLGGKPTHKEESENKDGSQNDLCPAIGFAMGIERVALLMQEKEKLEITPDIYLIYENDSFETAVFNFNFAEQLRNEFPLLKIESDLCFGRDNLNKIFGDPNKRAFNSHAKMILILTAETKQNKTVMVKDLNGKKVISIDELRKRARQQATPITTMKT